MKSSRTFSLESRTSKKLSSELMIGNEFLIATATSDLVEFYSLNKKRISVSHTGFPFEVK